MIAPHLDAWLQRLQQACAAADIPHLYIIIDQAGSHQPLLAAVQAVEPALCWHSLFDGLPEAAALNLAPLLVQVDWSQPQQLHWLRSLLQATDGQGRILAFVSRWPFSSLTRQLGHCMQASLGGTLGLLRFYDPRVFPVLMGHVLDDGQRHRWLQPAVFWSWLDRDGQGQRLPGFDEPAVAREVLMPIELDDGQLEVLGCVSDATQALVNLEAHLPQAWSAEQRFQACYRGMVAASEAGELSQGARQAWVLKTLRDSEAGDTGMEKISE